MPICHGLGDHRAHFRGPPVLILSADSLVATASCYSIWTASMHSFITLPYEHFVFSGCSTFRGFQSHEVDDG